MNAQRLVLQLMEQTGFNTYQRCDVEAALSQLDQRLCGLLCEWAREAGLDSDIRDRLAVVALYQVLIHVADDVADGDTDYFARGAAQGATTQFTLQNLAALALLQAAVPASVRQTLVMTMAEVAAAQHMEVALERWTLGQAKLAAEGLNGLQMQAYMAFIAYDCPQAEPALGMSYGIAAHVSRDIATGDPRYLDLSRAARRELRAWARSHALRVYNGPSTVLRRQITSVFRRLN